MGKSADIFTRNYADVRSKNFIIGLFFQNFGILLDIRFCSFSVVFDFIRLSSSIFTFEELFPKISVFVVDIEVLGDFFNFGALETFVYLNGIVKANFRLTFQLILFSLYLKNHRGINRFAFFLNAWRSRWQPFRKEIFQILLVQTKIIFSFQ